ncbi:MAG: methyltransferase [Nocardioides sp.]|nr:methyltransferase [Nocardioides sp.]
MSPGQPVSSSVGQRRSAARTAVVWAALDAALRGRDPSRLRVLDVGGGTGGFAVRVAELGADVTVIDPSPDALAALDRRADEQGVAARVRGQQGDLATLADLVAPASVDVVLCHGVLEVVEDPGAALEALAAVLPPNGLLSLVVAQQHAAVVARAMAGHLQQAREILLGAPPPGPRRFTHDEVAGLVAAAGFGIDTVHAVRVFADLVPSSLLDLEPGAADALVALEEAVADRAEFIPLAQQLHLLATRS